MPGMVEAVAVPSDRELAALTQEVLRNNGLTDRTAEAKRLPKSPVPVLPGKESEPIKHVVFITKENHTFDGIFGGLAGAIAKLLMPGRDPGGCIVTVLLGIAGALIAGWLGHAIGWYDTGEGAGFIAAIVGALVLLLLYRVVAGRRRF